MVDGIVLGLGGALRNVGLRREDVQQPADIWHGTDDRVDSVPQRRLARPDAPGRDAARGRRRPLHRLQLVARHHQRVGRSGERAREDRVTVEDFDTISVLVLDSWLAGSRPRLDGPGRHPRVVGLHTVDHVIDCVFSYASQPACLVAFEYPPQSLTTPGLFQSALPTISGAKGLSR